MPPSGTDRDIHVPDPVDAVARDAETRPHPRSLPVPLIAAVAALGGLLFGYDTGIISAALLFIDKSFPIGTGAKQLVTSAIVAGALVGCLAAGPASDKLGRRPVIILSALLFALGSIASAWAGSVPSLTGARLLLGLAVGAVSQIIPVYIAELAPPARRGGMVVLFQLAIVGGILLSTVIGWWLGGDAGVWPFPYPGGNWRLMFLLGVLPAAILFAGMFLLPESPRFLALRGDLPRAFSILRGVRGSIAEAAEELRSILAQPREDGSWRLLFSRPVRPALLAGTGVAMFSQITGTNATIYYAPTILASAGFGAGAALQTQLLIGVTIVLATIIGLMVVDRWGRRTLMLRFLPVAALGLALLGASFLGGNPAGAGRYAAVAGLVGYEIFNVGSISVAIWLVGAEVFPLAIRGKGMSMVALSHWGFDLVVSLFTLSVVQALGTSGAFFLFAVINVLAWLFVFRLVPETKGRSLEQIEQSLQAGQFTAMR
ncbi:sugar porter family MFS transporter [Rhizosaccharibacter radicis]|uniref:Sugar porter family MFS transporter n=1 Tax=Rhizosaccharibacter radicis TaxID=2782605 RepID=A0ABT1VWN9_9PROT|nr:sugar porter family MFS transporter [Acetobacteraceae bacterium KSS12]